ncbi:MAG: serine/threonine protein kinase [Planctomycetes bacterium]|nr:serine/threonine protein kinase [Planctomycetota bacterium]
MSVMGEKKIGPYTVVDVLGKGGMGTVYLARGEDGVPVAVKTLSAAIAPDPDALARFSQEVEIVSRLDHSHIVRALGPLARDGEVHYFPMEFVPGKSLAEVLRQVGRFDAGRAVLVFRQLATGLDAAHRCGVVHRDLKPSNVLLTARDAVKITDFGVARAVDLTRLTLTGALIGTPAYMPPEMVQGKDPDERSDVYSFGVLAYEVVTGRLPFVAHAPLALLQKHVSEAPPPLETIDPGLPELLRSIVHKCLEKDPARRYESAAALLTDLECVHVPPPDAELSNRIQTFVARETVRIEARLETSRVGHRRRRIVVAALGALLLVLGVAIAALVRYYNLTHPDPGLDPANPRPGGDAAAGRPAPLTLVLRDGTVHQGSKVTLHPVTLDVLLTDEAGQLHSFPADQVRAYYPSGEAPDPEPATPK